MHDLAHKRYIVIHIQRVSTIWRRKYLFRCRGFIHIASLLEHLAESSSLWTGLCLLPEDLSTIATFWVYYQRIYFVNNPGIISKFSHIMSVQSLFYTLLCNREIWRFCQREFGQGITLSIVDAWPLPDVVGLSDGSISLLLIICELIVFIQNVDMIMLGLFGILIFEGCWRSIWPMD